MRGWWQDLTDLVLPAECGGCGRPRTVLCPGCRAVLSGDTPGRVRPAPEPAGLPVVHAAARYEDGVRALLLAHKERGALSLARPLGTALAGAVRAGLHRVLPGALGPSASGGGSGVPVLLVPVPSGRRAVRARGHDPARRIALAAAAELRRSGTRARVLSVLRQSRPVADQSGLGSRQRQENLAGALAVARGGAGLLRGGAVVLVDDVMTTGASLAEAARAVREARTGAEPGTEPEVTAAGAGATADGGYRDVMTAVYARVIRERSGEQMAGVTEGSPGGRGAVRGMAVPNTAGDVVCAAVVAAPPDSFEINRN
ncbi:ComF family protein [Streptomyces sp. NPDC093094]|uniref:ComF family protein n=1 Tax=Streptomyces sp. NPDC093094 TaxID=3366026 RepID=UPI0038138C20